MFCDNITCKHNQLGLECTKVPYNIEFCCKDRNKNFAEKEKEVNKDEKV